MMLNSSIIFRYGIRSIGAVTIMSVIDDLYSQNYNDIECVVMDEATRILRPGEIVAVSSAVGPRNKLGHTVVTAQSIVFKNRVGYDRYLADGITIFDTKE